MTLPFLGLTLFRLWLLRLCRSVVLGVPKNAARSKRRTLVIRVALPASDLSTVANRYQVRTLLSFLLHLKLFLRYLCWCLRRAELLDDFIFERIVVVAVPSVVRLLNVQCRFVVPTSVLIFGDLFPSAAAVRQLRCRVHAEVLGDRRVPHRRLLTSLRISVRRILNRNMEPIVLIVFHAVNCSGDCLVHVLLNTVTTPSLLRTSQHLFDFVEVRFF